MVTEANSPTPPNVPPSPDDLSAWDGAPTFEECVSPLPAPGEVYRHFKGGLYEIIGIGFTADTLKIKTVIYKGLGTYTLWTRPLNEFVEWVPSPPPLRSMQPRYRKVGPDDIIDVLEKLRGEPR